MNVSSLIRLLWQLNTIMHVKHLACHSLGGKLANVITFLTFFFLLKNARFKKAGTQAPAPFSFPRCFFLCASWWLLFLLSSNLGFPPTLRPGGPSLHSASPLGVAADVATMISRLVPTALLSPVCSGRFTQRCLLHLLFRPFSSGLPLPRSSAPSSQRPKLWGLKIIDPPLLPSQIFLFVGHWTLPLVDRHIIYFLIYYSERFGSIFRAQKEKCFINMTHLKLKSHDVIIQPGTT